MGIGTLHLEYWRYVFLDKKVRAIALRSSVCTARSQKLKDGSFPSIINDGMTPAIHCNARSCASRLPGGRSCYARSINIDQP